MDVLAILKQNPRAVYTITSDQSVDDAIKLMTAKKVGALIVTDGDDPAGIFTDRDVFRSYLQVKNFAPSAIKLKKVIAPKLIAAKPTDSISAVVNLMIKSDINHLPVMENRKIIGVLALRDLVENQIESLTGEIHQLKDYIDDLHEAGRD